MKHRGVLAAICLCCSISLAAQTPSAPSANHTVAAPKTFTLNWTQIIAAQKNFTVNRPPIASGCPVSMHASQIGGGTTVMIDNDGRRHPIQHGIHLSLTDTQHNATIRSAQVTVHGLNGKIHPVENGMVIDLSNFGDAHPWDISRTVNVKFGSGEDNSAETDLSLAGFASITWISLDSLNFSDGSVWVPLSALACRITPDPFMLISAK